MMEPPAPPTAKAGVDQAAIIELGEVTLDASGSRGAVDSITIMSYLWEQTDNGPNVTLSDTTIVNPRFTAPFVTSGGRSLMFTLTVTDSNGLTATDTVTVTVSPSPNVDADKDSLIEIDTLTMLHNMRYNLAGTSYKTSASATGLTSGCPSDTCTGYELTQNLNFDTDGDGSTYTESIAEGFTLDAGDDNDVYFDVEAGGWLPIGDVDNPFTTIFEGNGHTISNLVVHRNTDYLGFLGATSTGAIIRNIGLVDILAYYSGSDSISTKFIGGLVGLVDDGSIIASYATGFAVSSNLPNNRVGILVGQQSGGSIVASYASGTTSNLGNTSNVGVLVGYQTIGSITASYASGTASSGTSGFDRVGGLVGLQAGDVIASYATGTATNSGTTTTDYAGTLLGQTHDIHGITDSYGFGTASAVINNSDTVGNPPDGVTAANMVATAGSAGVTWNAVANKTLGAWDFGDESQAPVLRYADYDGPDGDVYSCDGATPTFPAGFCGTIIPGQGR